MDKLILYRKILQEVLHEYADNEMAQLRKPDDLQIRLIIDTIHDHYQVLYAGWQNDQQIFSPLFHFDIINEKIWIQRNITDYDIIVDIENKGVPKSDIVLAFNEPQMRHCTEYATA